MTSASPDRLNGRHVAIIENNRDLLRGKRVLDIASHDGRWSFAALQAGGAAHVIGVEARAELVENARMNFAHYGVEAAYHKFIQGDVFDVLSKGELQVDVVLCLGYLYHTIRHAELFDLIERTGASHIILDTEIIPWGGPNGELVSSRKEGARIVWPEPVALQMIEEPVDNESMAYQDSITRSGLALVARPSVGYLKILSSHFGFLLHRVEWASILSGLKDLGQLNDYVDGWRGTFVCSKQER